MSCSILHLNTVAACSGVEPLGSIVGGPHHHNVSLSIDKRLVAEGRALHVQRGIGEAPPVNVHCGRALQASAEFKRHTQGRGLRWILTAAPVPGHREMEGAPLTVYSTGLSERSRMLMGQKQAHATQ